MIHIESIQMIVCVPKIGQSYDDAKAETEDFFQSEEMKEHYSIPGGYTAEVESDDEDDEEYRFLVSFSAQNV